MNNPRGVSKELLEELSKTYRPDLLKARLLFGHPCCSPEEAPAYGQVESVELDGDVLYANASLTRAGEQLIQEGKVTYVSISFTCICVSDKDEVEELIHISEPIDPTKAVPLGDGYWGIGYQVDEHGNLVGGSGIYLNHVALLGASDPAIPGQPTLQEQVNLGGLA